MFQIIHLVMNVEAIRKLNYIKKYPEQFSVLKREKEELKEALIINFHFTHYPKFK